MTRNRKQDEQRRYGAAALFSRLAGIPCVMPSTTKPGMSWSEDEQLHREDSPPVT